MYIYIYRACRQIWQNLHVDHPHFGYNNQKKKKKKKLFQFNGSRVLCLGILLAFVFGWLLFIAKKGYYLKIKSARIM
jgi:hypothetical protein